jgi:calcineurin-like phosphoesterase family protein
MYYFTADEHYGHLNIIKYCKRPFRSVDEMDTAIIKKHNEFIRYDDYVIHAGDFSLGDKEYTNKIINRLNGHHIFLKGSHDYWLKGNKSYPYILEMTIDGQFMVICHYAMRVWAKSHYNSWQLYGHSHGQLEGIGKQIDIGVDTHNFYPYSFKEIKRIMAKKEDNFNLVKK